MSTVLQPAFEIPASHKFACIALESPVLTDGLPSPLQLRPNLWAFTSPPFEMDDTWKEWLGSIHHQGYKSSALHLMAIASSNAPEMFDGENLQLENQVIALLYSLNLLEAARYGDSGGQVLTGARVGDAIQLRQHSFLPAHYIHEMLAQVEVDAALLQRAVTLADNLLEMFGEDPLARLAPRPRGPGPGTGAHVQDYARLRKGFNALLRAFRAESGNERLHRSVTALAAVVLPEVNRGRRHFAHRCGIIAGLPDEAGRVVLGEVYNLRNCEEHLNDWESVVAGSPDPTRTASLRSVQAEHLACGVYVRLLENANLRGRFTTDDTTRAYWAQPDDVVAADWRPPIDITETALAERLL